MSLIDNASRLILASSSPRRLQILRAHRHNPQVFSPEIDESLDASISLADLPIALEQLALAKAHSVLSQLSLADSELAIIIAADTVVYFDRILGKPQNHDEAVAMLVSLRGKTHTVLTSMAVIAMPTGIERTLTETARVTFGDYSLEQIERYLVDEPPFDKAGSYAIQGIWGKQVVSVEGDIETVIGLPYSSLEALLHEVRL